MKITCPHCQLEGNISEDKLKASSGKLRCPRCKKAFSHEAVVYVEAETSSASAPPPPADTTIDLGDLHGEEITKNDKDTLDVDIGELGVMGEEDSLSLDLGEDLGGSILEEPKSPLDDLEGPSFGDPLGPLSEETIASHEDEILGPIDEIDRVIVGDEPKKEKRTKKKKKEIGTGYIILLVIALIWGASYFGWTYIYKPYTQESLFMEDSKALYEEYHKIDVYLEVGIPKQIFVVNIAEMAYPYNVYSEKYKVNHSKDPLYVSLVVTGRLFLTTKELLEREMLPEAYLGVEWGRGFPDTTKAQYTKEIIASTSLCLEQMEKNFKLSRAMLDIGKDLSLAGLLWNPKRNEFAPELKKANRDFLTIDATLPVLKETIKDTKKAISDLP